MSITIGILLTLAVIILAIKVYYQGKTILILSKRITENSRSTVKYFSMVEKDLAKHGIKIEGMRRIVDRYVKDSKLESRFREQVINTLNDKLDKVEFTQHQRRVRTSKGWKNVHS